VAFLPRDLPSPAGRVCVVLDVLRASSTLVTLLERGARPLYVAGTVVGARALADLLAVRPLLCGEIGGLPPDGFDHGNSPTELAGEDLRGRPAVLATSNGTRALAALAGAPAVLVGCFLNASAVAGRAAALARVHDAAVALVCAGDENGTQFSLEDALAAGCLVDRLAAAPASSLDLDDAAVGAWRLYRSYLSGQDASAAATAGFADASHGRDLATLGFSADLIHCARVDLSSTVPELRREGERLLLRGSVAD
jgi:2-phosphosulfolactate phosphatase